MDSREENIQYFFQDFILINFNYRGYNRLRKTYNAQAHRRQWSVAELLSGVAYC